MTNKELKYELALIDMKIGGLELKLGLDHKLSELEKVSIRGEIMGLRDKGSNLKGAFRLS